MVLLCFVLDLCGLSPPLLSDLKQCLLQLANFYAISCPSRDLRASESLGDRIGLCYIFKNRISCSHELKIAYAPLGNCFNLRDFHHAVNNLPGDAFFPDINDAGAVCSGDVKLSSVLIDRVLYTWGDKDIMRKVIVLSSCLPENVDSSTKKTLMDAADKCVSVEFVLFEQSSGHLTNIRENINCFLRSLSDLDNCSFQTYLPDGRIFQSLVKQWLQNLNHDMEDPLQARFVFNRNLLGSLNHVFCNLTVPFSPIVDGFNVCQTCRCHGNVLDCAAKGKVEGPSCPVTRQFLETQDIIESCVRVGDGTVLSVPSFQSSVKLKQVPSLIDFNVINRTNLGSVSEGVIIGSSYFVTPSASHDADTSLDQVDQSELNAQLFKGVCNAIHSMDQGLVCSSNVNLETMREANFQCYYILQPSDNGPMLLRRLAASEEVLPLPDVNLFSDTVVAQDIQNSVQACLLKMELQDYNPVLLERGFHQKLNQLIKESSQFGSIPARLNEAMPEQNSNQPDSWEGKVKSNSASDAVPVEEEMPQLDRMAFEGKNIASIAEEWELLVEEVPTRTFSPTCISKPKLDLLVLSPSDDNKQLDVKTSRILERLEAPRQLKTKVVSPTSCGMSETCVPTTMPLIPFQPTQAMSEGSTASQLMKPNFNRLKRKHK